MRLVGKYTDREHMSLALTDSLVCLEMPLFAIAHVSVARFGMGEGVDVDIYWCAFG